MQHPSPAQRIVSTALARPLTKQSNRLPPKPGTNAEPLTHPLLMFQARADFIATTAPKGQASCGRWLWRAFGLMPKDPTPDDLA